MMKKWKQAAAIGILALYLTGCKESRPAEETTVNEIQAESTGTETQDMEDNAAQKTNTPEEAGEETPAADAEEIKRSNPMEEVSDPQALSEIGVSMGLPETAQDIECFIISQVVAEVNFKLQETPYTYRASATAEDFAGIFEEFEEEIITIPGTEEMAIDGDLIIKTTKSSGKLASWSKNGASYTLYTPESVEEDTLVSICQELISQN